MSKAALKKTLRQMEAESLVEVICELYDARPEAKEYLEYWLNPDADKALSEAKQKVEKMFFYSTGKNRKEPTATALKRLVKDFSAMVFDSEKTADLLLYIAEQHYRWASQKLSGFTSAEISVKRSLDHARIYIESAGLETLYGIRLERLGENIDKFFRDPPPQRRKRRRWW